MSDDPIAAAMRRLINLWLQNCEQFGEDYAEFVPLKRMLQHDNVQAVAELDLLREFDRPLAWDRYRTRELVRQWLRERPAGRVQ
jgi:hypothetical protein